MGGEVLLLLSLLTKYKYRHGSTAKRTGVINDRLEDRLIVGPVLADDFQNMRRGFFPLESFLHLAELPDVFDGNHGLGGIGFNKGDFRWLKRADLSSEEGDVPDRSSVLHQRNEKHAADVRCIDHRPHDRAVCLVKIAVAHIGKGDHTAVDDAARGIREIAIHQHLAGFEQLDRFVKHALMCGKGLCRVFGRAQDQSGQRRIAECTGVVENRMKDRLFIFAALADDFQDLGRRAFAAQTLLHLAELAYLFDGDDSLIRERLHKRDLTVFKRAHLLAKQDQAADPGIIHDQRDEQVRANALQACNIHDIANARAVFVSVGHVAQVDHACVCDGAGGKGQLGIVRQAAFVVILDRRSFGAHIRHQTLHRIVGFCQNKCCKRCLAQVGSPGHNRFENGLFIVRSIADQAQDRAQRVFARAGIQIRDAVFGHARSPTGLLQVCQNPSGVVCG